MFQGIQIAPNGRTNLDFSLVQQEDSQHVAGYIVYAKVLNKCLVLKFKKKVPLLEENTVITVDVLNEKEQSVPFTIKDLLHQNGLIFVVPSSLYEHADDGEIIYNEVIAQDVGNVFLQMDYEESGLTDEELSLIPDITDADEPSPAIDLPCSPYPMDQGFYLVLTLKVRKSMIVT